MRLAVAAESAFRGFRGQCSTVCATPCSPLSRNVGRKAAFEMLVTGEFSCLHRGCPWAGQSLRARRWLDQEIEKLTDAIVAKPASVIAAGKALFYRQLELGVAAAYELAGPAMARNMIDDVAQEGVAAFIEKRAPGWSVKS